MAYLYREMRLSDSDEVRQLYYQFFRTETLVQALGMEVPRECNKFVEYGMTEGLHNGVSVVAVNAKTGKLIGMNVCVIATQSNDQNWEYPYDDADCKTMKRVYAILDKMAITDNYFKMYAVNKILLSRGMVVYPEYQHQGIGFNMLKTSVELARHRDVGLVIMDCTSVYSKKIMDRFGFEKVSEINLEEHIYLPDDSVHKLETLHVLRI